MWNSLQNGPCLFDWCTWQSLMAKWLEQASQWHEMYCHDLEVMSSNPGQVKLGVRSTSVLSRTWSKNIFLRKIPRYCNHLTKAKHLYTLNIWTLLLSEARILGVWGLAWFIHVMRISYIFLLLLRPKCVCVPESNLSTFYLLLNWPITAWNSCDAEAVNTSMWHIHILLYVASWYSVISSTCSILLHVQHTG